MTSARVFLVTLVVAALLAAAGAISKAAATPNPPGVAVAAASVPVSLPRTPNGVLPTPVCNPSWGGVVIPICI